MTTDKPEQQPDVDQPLIPSSRTEPTAMVTAVDGLRAVTGGSRWVYGAAKDWLADRGDDLRRAVTGGWDNTETWIKASLGGLGLLGASAVGGSLLSLTATGLTHTVQAAADLHVPGSANNTGLLASITTPVWSYLRTHTQGLAVSPTTAYSVWALTVLGTGVLSFATRSFGARLSWALTGAATGWMAWHGAPAVGREVAVGLTALAWALLSIPALRGFRVGRSTYQNVDVRPQVHVPEPVVKRVEINGRALKSIDD
ncbi:hypothetical protein ACFY2W_36125 [Streptomyces sp. NPDC001262]|uniref:hypothetical protein n=1 Tax=Streptomyces sp. NPDC001262 TaxID=3364552 RepID=UPI0036C113E8